MMSAVSSVKRGLTASLLVRAAFPNLKPPYYNQSCWSTARGNDLPTGRLEASSDYLKMILASISFPLWVLLLILVTSPHALRAQTTASVRGHITNESGAALSGTTVHVTNLLTNASRSITADDDGLYVASQLAPADYRISVAINGFADYIKELRLRIGE